jgi:hypothetical protein
MSQTCDGEPVLISAALIHRDRCCAIEIFCTPFRYLNGVIAERELVSVTSSNIYDIKSKEKFQILIPSDAIY